MKSLTVVGARPQFIKAAVVSKAIAAAGSSITDEIVHTGQHFDPDMSDVFFRQLDLPAPVVNLGLGGRSHGEATGAMLAGLEQEIIDRKPDMVVVYGDTNSTLAGALAAAKLHVPVAHVEAGLRSFDRRMPEEINRVVTDHLAALLLCPSEVSQRNLAAEGVTEGVSIVGDTMFDAVLEHVAVAPAPEWDGPFVLATIHREENTDDPLRLGSIMGALADAPVPVVLPLHPRTRGRLAEGAIDVPPTVRLVSPLGYLEMLGALQASEFVMTDSGGVQKEAYFLGKRCVTLRDSTEWTELVDLGANILVGASADLIRSSFAWASEPLLSDERPYGDGDAGRRIVQKLAEAASVERW